MTVENKTEETKAEKFQRLALKRMNTAIQKIELVGNLGSAQYDKTDEQIEQIQNALLDAVSHTMSQLKNTKTEKKAFAFA